MMLGEYGSQGEIAGKLGVDVSSINRRLDNAGYYTYFHAKKAITNELCRIWEELE